MILVCYDGSADAQAAIEQAARLTPGAEATVLTIWEPFIDLMTRNGAMGMGVGWATSYGDDEDVDLASQRAALENATEGARIATAAGLRAEPRIERRNVTNADSILMVAGDVDAELVVLGTRGLGGVKSFLLGSVSHDVVQHADRAVLVVPSPALAERRHGWARHAVAS